MPFIYCFYKKPMRVYFNALYITGLFDFNIPLETYVPVFNDVEDSLCMFI